MTAPPVVCESLTKRFGDVVAVDALSMTVRPGEVLGFLGPNGAGKSTTIRLLLGFLRPTSGTARIFGADAFTAKASVHQLLAYVPGDVALWDDLTGEQTLTLLGEFHGSLDASYRRRLVDRFALDTSRRVGELSKGNRQKVALVAALATRAELLVLDEPTSGLDPLMEQAFRISCREAADAGQAVLLSSHILSEVEAIGDRFALIRDGRLVDVGSLAELRRRSASLYRIRLGGAPPPGLDHVEGVQDVRWHDGTMLVRAREPQPVLQALAGCDVIELTVAPPSLEELFLDHYVARRP